jgi:hypothetical protein
LRCLKGDDFCCIRAGEGNEVPRFFLRTILPVPLTDIGGNTQWGLWIKVAEADAKRAWDLWDAPDQAQEPPSQGFVANHIKGYPDTVGLPVVVRLTGPTTRPRSEFPEDLAPLCRRVPGRRYLPQFPRMAIRPGVIRNDAAVNKALT